MFVRTRRLAGVGLAVCVGAAVLVADDTKLFTEQELTMSAAEARIGRPATPLSYAGVARRTTRRAVATTAVVAAPVVVAPPVVVTPAPVVVAPGPGCVQAVDAYGRIYWRC